jgi:hypothetical protein
VRTKKKAITKKEGTKIDINPSLLPERRSSENPLQVSIPANTIQGYFFFMD